VLPRTATLPLSPNSANAFKKRSGFDPANPV
jgi:hypothetical protein